MCLLKETRLTYWFFLRATFRYYRNADCSPDRAIQTKQEVELACDMLRDSEICAALKMFETTNEIWYLEYDCLKQSSPGQNGRLFQTSFSDAFHVWKIFIFWLKFHWSVFLGIQLTATQHCFRKLLCAEWATSHYVNQFWPDSLTHICGGGGLSNIVVSSLALEMHIAWNGLCCVIE